MECNKDEAIRAKNIAENKMKNDDYEGARKIALKAQKLYPQLDNISQLLAVCDVMCSAERKICGKELDVYGILQVESNADEETIKKHYRKRALALHPDKNQFPGAEAAFKLINEANRILSDKRLRCIHDVKCTPKQTHQANQKSHAGMQSGARATQFNGVNVNQQSSQTGSNGTTTFWTCCPFCKIKYQYYIDVKNKRLKCSKCSRPFTAIDIGSHVQQPAAQPPHSSRAGQKNTGRPQPEHVGKQANVKVDSQNAGSSSHFGTADAKTAENGNLNSESGKKGVESKETVGKPSVVSDSNVKRPRKRPQADFTPENKTKKTKSSDVKDKQKEAESKNDVSEPTASQNAEGSTRKNNKRKKDKLKEEDDIPNADPTSEPEEPESEPEPEPVYIDCPEPEFSNFDKDKEEGRFAADQFWAIYDTLDGMPRFYAQIKKVFKSPFRLKITWLEADPEKRQEIVWAREGLPVACGRFKRGATEDTSDRLMFSHQITCEKGSKRYSFAVYPQKGEIWALYRDWDFNWSSEPKSHKKFKYEIVEILSDFDKENGVLVSYMVKLEGFVSLFQKTGRARLAEHRVLSGELFRFSHRIPSTKMTGKERADVPVGSCELDTASLPDDLNEYFFSNNVKPIPENVSATDAASCPQSPGRKVNDSEKGTCNVRRSPRGSKGNLENSNGSSKADDPAGQNHEAIVIHDFHLDKQKWKFQEGQIWALNDKRYAQIKKIEFSPTIRLHVDLLELCSDAIRQNACGLYRASKDGRREVQQDSFLYLVHAEVNGKNRFNIYPREKEVWVLNNKDDTKGTSSHVDVGDCDIVEVLENNGDMIRVLSLSRVPGYKSVFRAVEIQNSKEKKVLEIPLADSNRFYCRVPAFLLTVEHDGRLEGSWELDFAVLPGQLLI